MQLINIAVIVYVYLWVSVSFSYKLDCNLPVGKSLNSLVYTCMHTFWYISYLVKWGCC